MASASWNHVAGADGQKASESHGVGPVAAAEPATTASGTVAACDASAACWEEEATEVAAAVGGPRQAAQAVTSAPPYLGGHQYNKTEISTSVRREIQYKT